MPCSRPAPARRRGYQSCPSPQTGHPDRTNRREASTNSPASESSTTSTPDRNHSSNSVVRDDAIRSAGTPSSRTTGHFGSLAVAIHLGPQVPSQLHRSHPHTTGSGVDQHRLPRLQTGEVHQGCSRRSRTRSAPTPPAQRPPLGYPGQQPGIGDGHRSERPVQQTHHPITDRQGRSRPERPRRPHRNPHAPPPRIPRIHAQHIQHIPEVHPRRPHRHPHLTGAKDTRLLSDQPHTIQPPLSHHIHPPPDAHPHRRHQTPPDAIRTIRGTHAGRPAGRLGRCRR